MVVKETWDEKIPFLTLYSFSTENWRRPINEVQGLMQIFIEAIDRYADELHQNQVKVRFIGKKEGFPGHLTERMENLEKLTGQNQGLTLNLALNYGGRDEIIRAFQKFLQSSLNQEREIGEDSFRQFLDTENQPDPDLLIRTGGEKRLSNYLLWQLAYSELYFTEILWPDFSYQDYHQALADFISRKRRFGGLG
jgi:undecaprenyl diphosphate synthase